MMIEKPLFSSHWSLTPDWQWPNFTPEELASEGDGSILVIPAALDALQKARDVLGPLIINSAYRDPLHNLSVGGRPQSKHLLGEAFDIQLLGYDKSALKSALADAGFEGFGMNYETFIHADLGPPRSW